MGRITNYSSTDGVPKVKEPLEDRMRAYDRLPRALRQLLDESPIEQSAVKTYELWEKLDFNTPMACSIFQQTIWKFFPGYTPPRARPRPTRK